jgi:hypothetical protein
VCFCQVGAQFASKTWMTVGNQTGQLTMERRAMRTILGLLWILIFVGECVFGAAVLYIAWHFITKLW